MNNPSGPEPAEGRDHGQAGAALRTAADQVAALNRIAEAIERIAAQEEASHSEGRGIFNARP